MTTKKEKKVTKRFTIWTDETLTSESARLSGLVFGVYDSVKNRKHYIDGWKATTQQEAKDMAYDLNAPKRGGSRPGAGRPEVADPKIKIQLGVAKSKVDKIGSEEKVKQVCLDAIDYAANDLPADDNFISKVDLPQD